MGAGGSALCGRRDTEEEPVKEREPEAQLGISEVWRHSRIWSLGK